MSVSFPEGMSWHPHTAFVPDMAALEDRLDGYGPGHALSCADSDMQFLLTIATIRAGGYTFNAGRWTRRRPMGGRYVLLCNGAGQDPSPGFGMWIEGVGGTVGPTTTAPTLPTARELNEPARTMAPGPKGGASGGPSVLGLGLGLGVLLALLRKGGSK